MKLITRHLITFIAFTASSLSASAAPFYAENFNFDSAKSTNTFDAFTQTGWKAFRGGSKVGTLGLLKAVPGISRNLLAYNSYPMGPDDGYALWTKETNALTVFTEEHSFNIADLESVSYLQRLSGSVDEMGQSQNDGTRLILKIRTVSGSEQWYISDTVVPQEKRFLWENVDFAPKSMTFGIQRFKRDFGPQVTTNSGNPLPQAGVVTGFGVFVSEVSGRVRIDNFTLNDALPSNGIPPQAIPTRPANTTPTPVNTEDPEPEPQGTPIPTPTATATPTPQITSNGQPVISYNFCVASSDASRRLVATRAVQRTVIRSLKGTSAIELRNRIIVELLVSGGMHSNALENIKVSDFYTQGGLYYLNVYGADKKPVRLSPRLVRNLSTYIQSNGLDIQPSSPLFRTFLNTEPSTLSAICSSDISKVLKSALRKAGVSRQVRFAR